MTTIIIEIEEIDAGKISVDTKKSPDGTETENAIAEMLGVAIKALLAKANNHQRVGPKSPSSNEQ